MKLRAWKSLLLVVRLLTFAFAQPQAKLPFDPSRIRHGPSRQS